MIHTRSVDAGTVEVLKGKRTIRAIIGSEAMDRHRTVVDPAGLEVENFRKGSKPVSWEHTKDATRGAMPIGNCTDIGLTTFKGKSVMVADTRFWEDSFSDTLFNAYADGRLNGWSIFFSAKSESPPTRGEIRARPELERCTTVYRSAELIDYSAVAIPSNTDANTIEVIRSMTHARSMGTSRGNRHYLDDAAFRRRCEQLVRDFLSDIKQRPHASQLELEAMLDRRIEQAKRERTYR
jgi:hypothetical protein